MKLFTIIKIGYTAGMYGCSGEYFNCIFVDKRGLNNFIFRGMYGAEDRIRDAMTAKGFKNFFTPSIYGKLTRKDGIDLKWLKSEYQALDFINKEKLDWDFEEKQKVKKATK